MGSSSRAASSRQRDSKSPPGSETKDRNVWGVQDVTAITYTACEETRKGPHTSELGSLESRQPPSIGARGPRQPRQRSGCVDVHSTALRCFDRQTAFSISVSVLVVPCGSSDLSSSTPDPTHAPWTGSAGVLTIGRPRSPAFCISGQLKIKTSDTRSSSLTLISYHAFFFF